MVLCCVSSLENKFSTEKRLTTDSPINRYGPNASRYKYGGASDGLIKLCPEWVMNLRGKMFSVTCEVSAADLSQSLGDHSYANVRKCYLVRTIRETRFSGQR
jgi:hypothetical protein